VDETAVTRWLVDHVEGIEPPLRFELIAGGRSNLTFLVSDAAGRRCVLRRPPLGHVLASAHDVAREHRILSALAGRPGVPVPAPLALCEDETVNGAPFVVMDFVEGTVIRDPADAARLAPEVRRTAAESLIDVLAALHLLEPDEVGLGELGRRDGYVERQLRRWTRQIEEGGGRRIPALVEAPRRLAAVVPDQQRASIVHGDYRIDNALLDADGTVAGVVDWELCTLGDPLADLGQFAVYWTEPDDVVPGLLGSPTGAGGFPGRDDLLARYGKATGLDLSAIDVYRAFGYWRIACILEGVLTRYDEGVGGGDDRGVEEYREQVPLLAAAAVDLLPAVP
jgi:aminoglycoside phosphotransferase (APT) family kinase protein